MFLMRENWTYHGFGGWREILDINGDFVTYTGHRVRTSKTVKVSTFRRWMRTVSKAEENKRTHFTVSTAVKNPRMMVILGGYGA